MPRAAKMKKKTNAAGIILALIILLTALAIAMHKNSNENPNISIEKITSKLMGSSQAALDENRFNEIKGMDYGRLKEYFNVNRDFFIYMEDADGRIILAKGDEKLTAGSDYCK